MYNPCTGSCRIFLCKCIYSGQAIKTKACMFPPLIKNQSINETWCVWNMYKRLRWYTTSFRLGAQDCSEWIEKRMNILFDIETWNVHSLVQSPGVQNWRAVISLQRSRSSCRISLISQTKLVESHQHVSEDLRKRKKRWNTRNILFTGQLRNSQLKFRAN